MPTEYAGLERPADINGDNDGNGTAGSIAVLAATTGTSGRALEGGEIIEYSSVCC